MKAAQLCTYAKNHRTGHFNIRVNYMKCEFYLNKAVIFKVYKWIVFKS